MAQNRHPRAASIADPAYRHTSERGRFATNAGAISARSASQGKTEADFPDFDGHKTFATQQSRNGHASSAAGPN
jgi:hypothetical protein